MNLAIQNHQELIEAGCAHADPDRIGVRSNFTTGGPGGQPGVVFAQKLPDKTDGPPPLYDPKLQTWRKHPSGKFWVGFITDDRPTPETLRRSTPLLGQTPVKLLDGEEWIVPVCTPTEYSVIGSSLPQAFDFDDTSGEMIAKHHPRYESVARRVYDVFAVYIGMTPHPLQVAKAQKRKPTAAENAQAEAITKSNIKLAVEVLALNYRLGEFEAIGLLGLLGTDEYFDVLRAAFEADAIDAASAELSGNALASGDSPTDSGSTVAVPAAASTEERASTGALRNQPASSATSR